MGDIATDDNLITSVEVHRKIGGLSRTTRWKMIRDGEFPAPVKVGWRRHLWSEREINEWIAARLAARPNVFDEPTRASRLRDRRHKGR